MQSTLLRKLGYLTCVGALAVSIGACAHDRYGDRFEGMRQERGSLKDFGPVRTAKPKAAKIKPVMKAASPTKPVVKKSTAPVYAEPDDEMPVKAAPAKAYEPPVAKEPEKVEKPAEPAAKDVVEPAPVEKSKPVVKVPPPVAKPDKPAAAPPPPVKKTTPAKTEQKPVAATPEPQPKPTPAPPVTKTEPSAPTQAEKDKAETKRLIAEGKKLMAQGDVLGARELFIKAMRYGSDPEAMKAYASTFGANFLGGDKK